MSLAISKNIKDTFICLYFDTLFYSVFVFIQFKMPAFVAFYTVKKGYRFSRTQPGCHSPNTLWPGIIKLFLARESLVSNIPAWDRKNDKLFLQCRPTD
jgi:hypothetical protein